ncbi:MAG TPA: hypothetical protein VGD64_15495 [Acidisarcina sp.]
MKKFKLLVASGCYIAALLWAYAVVISPAFFAEGYTLAWRNPAIMVWLVVLSLLPAVLLPYSIKTPSALILWWLYLSTYVPSILVPAISLSMPIEKLFPLQVSLLVSMSLLCIVPSRPILRVRRLSLSPHMFWASFVAIWVGCLSVVIVTGHPQNLVANVNSLFAGATEYDIRSLYFTESNHAIGYIVGQLGQAFDPFLIAYGLVFRRKPLVLAGVAGQVLIFSFTGFKVVLFSTFLLPLVFWFLRAGMRNFGLRMTYGLAGIIVACGVADLAVPGSPFSGMITRRTLAGPGLLTGFYFEHYSEVAHPGIGYRFGTGALYGPSNEIGRVYFVSDHVDANANLWAEGFADFGIGGILGFTLFVGFLIWMYDSAADPHRLDLAALLAVLPAISLGNTSPTTVVLTHGALAVVVLLYLSPTEAADMAPEDEEETGCQENALPLQEEAEEEEHELMPAGVF